MKKYALITYYNMGTEKNQHWAVFGNIEPYENDLIGTFDNENECLTFSINLHTPVMRGATNSTHIQDVLEKLC